MIYTYKEATYLPWGKVLEMTDGVIDLKVTLDIGPRVIYLALKGGVNVMYEDVDSNCTKGGEYFDCHFGKDAAWQIIGGHRLWKSPEDLASYYPDQNPVKYEVLGDKVIFMSEVESTTDLIKSIAIEMLGGGRVKLYHEFFNGGDKTFTGALWGLTVLKPGGKLLIPTNDRGEGFLPTRNYVLWPYSDIKDSRFFIGDGFLSLEQKTPCDCPFKLGGFFEKGTAAYVVDGTVFRKNFPVDKDIYPDFDCNFETYTNEFFLECESLSPIKHIKPAEKATHVEEWELSRFEGTVKGIAGNLKLLQ